MKRWMIAPALLMTVMACGQAEEKPASGDEFGIVGGDVNDFGKATFLPNDDKEEVPGKADAITGRGGLPVSVDNLNSSVWEVKNQWEDVDTPAARKAGMAWGENSGMTWEEKFSWWIDTLEQTESKTQNGVKTYKLTTPWGKAIDAPSLECAESAIFLRVAFASWYNLPFFLEAADAEGRIYFGHFGMRRSNGKFARTPDFKTRYKDYSDRAQSILREGSWPVDTALAKKKIPGSADDAQPMIGPDAHTGAYFDQIFLNKRVGHFLITTLAYYGSIHLAGSRNTFNVKPQGIKTGDVLVQRWQRRGIGHVLLVMNADQTGADQNDPRYEVELASGSMPRRQPYWESANTSMRSFTSEHSGGPGYAELGGGLKRWRIARAINGRWTNVVSRASSGDWVNSNDLDAIGARTETFEQILKALTREEKRDTLLQVIDTNRAHLRRYPASCAARIRREKAFGELYELMRDDFGWTDARTDNTYRTMEDYVFAELSYQDSKTCCWNSSNNTMYNVIMDLNQTRQDNAQACMDVVVFKNRDDEGDGYEVFRQHAISMGVGDQWKPWSADESCPQANVAEDTEVDSGISPFCALDSQPTNTDSTTTGDFVQEPASIPDETPEGLRFELNVEQGGAIKSLALDIAITHTYRGDLEIELIHPDGTSAILKTQSGDSSQNLEARYTPEAFVGKDAQGTWTLRVSDMVGYDTGTLDQGLLTIER